MYREIEKPRLIELEKICLLDKEFIKEDKVKDFMNSIVKNKYIPPIRINRLNYILDGRHRWQAYKNLNIDKVLVEVCIGY